MIHFEIPRNQSSIIKVIGVGGGGGNAVNYMYSLGIDGVDFVVCNTDSQALSLSPIPNKIQLGPHLTQGLGAGANPEIGKQASEESFEDITKILKLNTKMAFITAGMGGGTGTGGAPVVAKICRDLGILTVGIVTMPFTYEGRKRMKQAQEGIDRMREHVDTILIISNDKLRQQFGNLPFTQAFAKADDVLSTAAKCITDVINTTGQINVDFADVCTVMKNGGVAILGAAAVAGENRALHAVEQALNSPLLNDNDINGAKWLLLNITSAQGEFEHTMDEAEAIQAYVQQQAGDSCDVILGMGHDPNLGDRIAVTVIATGFNHKEIPAEVMVKRNEPARIYIPLGEVSQSADEEPAMPVQKTAEALAPTLVEVEPTRPVYSFNPQPQFPATNTQEKREIFSLESNDASMVKEPESIPEQKTEPVAEATMPHQESPAPIFDPMPFATHTPVSDIKTEPVEKEEETSTFSDIQLVIKNEVPEESATVKIGSHVLSQDEIEEKRRFEEQKRALEERAERLRRMSFNIKGTESADEMEAVPAYVRRKIDIDNGVASADKFYSGYSVGVNDDQKNNQASIQTINTFLDGKKPD